MRSVVAGIGCRKGCSAEEILALLSDALDRAGNPHLRTLATAEHKRGEVGIEAAAAHLETALSFVDLDRLKSLEDRTATRSSRVEAATGVASVAEASALAVAGAQSRLVLPRIASSKATCALAEVVA